MKQGAEGELAGIIGNLGPKLRDLRQQNGLSQKQLAERADVSPATIHKVECSRMVPTVATLMKVATALNQPVSYFVDERSVIDRAVAFIAAHDRRPVHTSNVGLELHGITGAHGRFSLTGATATVSPHACGGGKAREHPGEELVFVFAGELEFEVDRTVHRLGAGDALHFRTDRPHRWRNPTGAPARAIWVALRPT